jgi:hypothetical protein
MPITDFRNLKEHGGASLSELKEFLSNLRGRSPQEVIGIVKTSLLIQSLIIATVATIAFLFVFTVAPYMIWGPQVTERPKKPQPPVAKSDGTPSSENTAKAVKAMGMDETKTADPKANPLEKDFDKLLDGAK